VHEHALDVDILSQGLLVRVSVYGTGIFDRSLRFEELGISSSDTRVTDHIKPGHKSYAPGYSDRLNSWGTQCRQAVAAYALRLESVDKLTASKSWRFLHFDAYPEFRARWDQLMALRDQIVRDIEREYDDLLDSATTFYVDYLSRQWDRLQRAYRDAGGVAVRIPESGVVFGPADRDRYVEWIAENVRADFPSMDRIRSEIYAEYHVNILLDPASLAQSRAQREEAEAREAEARLRSMRAGQEAWELARTREAREEAIREAEIARARQMLAETTDPFREAMTQLLAELETHIKALLGQLNTHGAFRGRSINRIDSMVELYSLFGGRNLPDEDIERLLHALRDRKDAAPQDREEWTERITQDLTDLNRHVTSQMAMFERRSQAQTRAGALEL
jgi:hypothetical protein